MAQQAYNVTKVQPFVVDPHSLNRLGGRQVNWSQWTDPKYLNSEGKVVIPAGSLCYDAADGLIPADELKTHPMVMLATGATQDSESDAISGYGVLVGGVVYKNLLPDKDHAEFDTMLANLHADGTGWRFVDYEDTRA